MKNFFCFCILISISVISFGQNYFISFSATGDTNQIGTIQVVNLTTLDTVWLNGSDTLNLIEWGVGLEKHGTTEHCNLTLSPNPVIHDAILNIQSDKGGSGVISINDISGRFITSKEEIINRGGTQFRLSGFPKGTYLIRLNGKGIDGSIKMISTGQYNRPTLNRISNGIDNNPLKFFSFITSRPSHLVQMTYHDGERLQFRAQTSTFRNLAVDVPVSSKTQNFHFLNCFDNSGHHYETVEIQVPYKKKSTLDSTYTQTWMAENLNVGEFRTVAQGFQNDTLIEKFCYNDSISNCDEYGGLYRWDEMMGYQTEDSVQGICPEGWRLPSQGDWQNLVNYYGGAPFGNGGPLSGDSIAGGKMKEVGTLHWNGNSPNYPQCDNPDATNETGFTAIAGGAWCTDSGIPGVHFFNRYTDGIYWTSTQKLQLPGYAYAWSMQCVDGVTWNSWAQKTDAHSVRCIHD